MFRWSRPYEDEDGISLVEMLVAVFIVGIILTALAQVLAASLVSLRGQERHIKANALANELIEEVQGVAWRDAGLCDSAATGNEATMQFGGTTFEGQDLVIIPDADPTCSTPDPGRLLPAWTVNRDGVDYDVVLALTWVDDAVDDGGGDANPQDYKRIVVDLSWVDRGTTRNFRAESRRAPIPLENDFTVAITPDIINIRNNPDESAVVGSNIDPFMLEAVSLSELSSVVARWVDRTGSPESRNLTTTDGGFTWKFDVPQNVGPFRNGETVFTFTATHPDLSQSTGIYRGLFLHALTEVSLTVPTEIEVQANGTVCPFTLDVHVRGALLSDEVDATFSAGPSAVAMLAHEERVDGAVFRLEYPVEGSTGWDVTATSTDLGIAVFRPSDGATLPISRTAIPVTQGVLLCSP